MTHSPQLKSELKLTRTLPVIVGSTTKTLPVVRLVATTHHRDWEGRESGPLAILASEKVEIIFRATGVDYVDMLPGIYADSVPYAEIQFGEIGTKAMVGKVEPILSLNGDAACLITFLLLRVSSSMLDIDAEWERDNEHSHSRNGLEVIAIRPKDGVPTVAGTALAKFDEWLTAGGDAVAAGIDIDAYRAVLQRQDSDERIARSQPSPERRQP